MQTRVALWKVPRALQIPVRAYSRTMYYIHENSNTEVARGASSSLVGSAYDPSRARERESKRYLVVTRVLAAPCVYVHGCRGYARTSRHAKSFRVTGLCIRTDPLWPSSLPYVVRIHAYDGDACRVCARRSFHSLRYFSPANATPISTR